MKKLLFLFVAIAATTFTNCSDGDEKSQSAIEVAITVGDTYSFDGAVDEVIIAPNDFYAKVTNNGIKGIHVGSTSTQVKVAGFIYDCKITVNAKHTLYVDMMYLLGADKETILKLYGEPIDVNKDSYLFGPLAGIGLEQGNIFTFENNIVKIAIIGFASSYATEIGKHLSERYVLVSSKDNSLLYINGLTYDSWTVGVFVTITTSSIQIMYASKEYLESQSSQIIAKPSFDGLLNERCDMLTDEPLFHDFNERFR